jgi:hypothetical protein
MKAYTDIEQSKKLAKILPFKSADMYYREWKRDTKDIRIANVGTAGELDLPCWSLTALLKYLSEIKPQVYTPTLFPSEGKWILHFVEYGHGIICKASCDNPIDACVSIIEKLNELKML